MSLQFVFGNSGAGKSRYLCENMVRESLENPQTNYIMLVPEQFTLQTQRDLCMFHPRRGIMNIEVLSFARLSHRVFAEIAKEPGRVLDDEGKNLILRKVAGKCREELRVLRENLQKQGTISEIKSVISEFSQYGIRPEDLAAFLEAADREGSLYYKLEDIRKIYEEFERYLEEKYITKEELPDRVREVVPDSALLKNSVVALDGFTGFTPVQNRLLGALMKVCKKVILTVEMDERENPFVYRHPYELFAVSRQTVTSLMNIAGKEKILVEDPVFLYGKPPYRFRKSEELAFLEAKLFRYDRCSYGKEPEKISVHMSTDPRRESDFVAASIHRLAREKGLRYRDMAVIASDMATYAAHLEKAFEVYEIPVFIDYKKSILLNAFVEYMRSLLAMAEQNFTYESVFRFLRTGMTGFTREEVDRMENYVLALGLNGYEKWKSVWARRTKYVNQEELSSLNTLRVRFVEKVDALMSILKKRRKTVRDITQAVHEFFLREQVQQQVRKMEENFQKAGELALAKEYAQIYRIVVELFDKFVELLGDEQVSLKEYCEILDAGLQEAKVGVIPPSLDQVVVGDVERTRIHHIKVLFFVGANDIFLPGRQAKGKLLTERDREAFSRQKMMLSPGAKEKLYIQKFYLYLNLTKPSEYLYLSFSKTALDGKTLRPAYLVTEFFELYPQMHLQNEEERPLSERELTRKKGAEWIAEGLSDRISVRDVQWKELYSWYRREGAGSETDRLLDAAFYKKIPEFLDKELAGRLYGDREQFSVTRLERFAACAYAHFLEYGLCLSKREQYQFEAIDLGNIAHQSLERFARKADQRNKNWPELSQTLREEMIEESVEESIADYGNTVLYSTARNEYMITRIKRLVRRSVWALTKQLEQGDFRVSAYEMKFGSGKIDRVDTCEDENQVYVKVTDYKTGAKSFDITAFYHGLQIQLPVYLNIAMEAEKKQHPHKEVVPAGIFYYHMQDPLVEKEEDVQKLEEKLLQQLKLDGIVNSSEEVLAHLEKDVQGSSNFYPLGRNHNGSFNQRISKILSPYDFTLFLEYTKQKEAEMKRSLAEGEAAVKPYKLGNRTGCDYCLYQTICGFDSRLDGCDYRILKKYSKEEALGKIRSGGAEIREKEQKGGGEGGGAVDKGTAAGNPA